MSVALARAESWEDHIEAWHHIGREVDGAAWGRAAIAASLKGRYGDDAVVRFAKEVGYSPSSIYKFARTFETFPEECARAQNLTFSHHLLAVVLTENATEARAAVEHAEREGWSANALRAHLRPPTLPVETCAREEGACGPITGPDRLLHTLVVLRDLYLVKDYEPDPILNACKKRDLKDLHTKLTAVAEWVQSLQTAINGRLK